MSKYSVHLRTALDIGERALWTAVQVFITLLLASDVLNVTGTDQLNTLKQIGLAALAAGIAAIKGLGASFFGSKGTASTLPADLAPVIPGA